MKIKKSVSLRMIFSNKRIVVGAVVALVVISAIIGGTVAYFSDTEVSIGNTFKAGKLNLKIDNTCQYNGKICALNPQSGSYEWGNTGEDCHCTWQLADILENQLFFNLLDVKPGDSGEDTISFHIDNNDAWLCAEIFNLQNNENGCDTPENRIDTTCHYLGNEGELGQNLFFSIWKDDGAGNGIACNNIKDGSEFYILQNQVAEAGLWAIADSTTATGPIPGSATLCYGISWNVPLSTSNIIQSDALVGSLKFSAIQSRHMDTFKCSELVPTNCVPITEICGDGIDQDCNGSDLACPPAECTTVADCDDNNLCTEEAVCDNGVCIRTPLPCSDGNTCTVDTCDPILGCQHAIPPETCNGLDDDCDGQIDEQGANGCQIYVYDGDADDYGVTGVQACLCAASGNYTAILGGDCNDNDSAIHPTVTEICNDGKDNDCDDYTDCADSDCVNDAACQQILTCTAAEEIFCGVPESGNTTDTGSADIINAYSCTNWNETGREYVYSFSPGGVNRNVTLGLSYMSADLDIFILEDDCAPGSCVAFDGNTANFIAEAGKTYYFSVDGNNGAQGSYTVTATCL